MILRFNKWLLAACCCLAVLTGPALAQKPSKGGGAEPYVKYTINWLGNPYNFVDLSSHYYPFDMNNDGHVVGALLIQMEQLETPRSCCIRLSKG